MLSNAEIGRRLRTIRKSRGLRRSDAARESGVARATLVAIEQGRRRVRTDEIQRLARLYGTSVNGVLRSEAVHLDLVSSFRKLLRGSERRSDRAAQRMNRLVCAQVELENVLGVQRQENPPPEHPILPGDLVALAREAWKRDLYSEGQLADLLDLDRLTIREVLEGAQEEEAEAVDREGLVAPS